MPFILRTCHCFLKAAESLQPVTLLAARLWMAKVFWVSGLVKISDFDTTVALFELEYRVPLLPPVLAAFSATVFELLCPILLALGLATRLAALPLLGMTAVIHLTYNQNEEHLYWAILLSILVSVGAGKLSLDHVVKRNTIQNGV